MIKYSTQSGFSLVEVLVSIAILLVAVVGPMSIAASALQTSQYARQQNTAFFLAQEGIEAVVAIRNEAGMDHIQSSSVSSDSWLNNAQIVQCRGGTGCGLHFVDGTIANNTPVTCTSGANNPCKLRLNTSNNQARYYHSASGGVETPYTRSVYIRPTGGSNGEVRVISRVVWQPAGNLPAKRVELVTYIYDIYDL